MTSNESEKPGEAADLTRERYELLQRLDDWLETPMLVLAFVWLVLLVLELVQGENPLFYSLGMIIWAIFILDFGVAMVLAPDRRYYLKRNWLTAVSLVIPALRIFRIFRAFRLLRLALFEFLQEVLLGDRRGETKYTAKAQRDPHRRKVEGVIHPEHHS